MGTMGLQYIFSFFNPLKNGDDGINTINGEEKNITNLPCFDNGLKQKIAQKNCHTDTAHIFRKSFGLLADIKKSKDHTK